MALIVGTSGRFRPEAARVRGLDSGRVYKLAKVYRMPGDPVLCAVEQGVTTTTPVKLNELR
jgi:hypothetical protein